MSGRSRAGVATVAAGVLALAWGAARVAGDWRYEARLGEARQLARSGRADRAGPILAQLAADRPARGDVGLLLGDAEDALGRPEGALAAWSRVPAGSPEAGPAGLRRGRRAIDLGRLAEAEDALAAAARAPGPQVDEARERLARLLWRQARFAESAALIEARWRDLFGSGRLDPATALDLVRAHLALDFETFPADRIEAELRREADRSPGDGRIRLALARWATRGGRLAEAGPILEACTRARPDDPEPWLARLEWARAAGRPAEARAALGHIPADRLGDREVASLRAWLAATRGDEAAERAHLGRLAALAPDDLTTLGRLAELHARAGDPAEAARLRDRKARLADARHRYAAHFKDDDLLDHAPELARLAGELGRGFEAWAFATLAAWRDPGNPALREAMARAGPPRPTPAPAAPGVTLAGLLAADLGPAGARPRDPSGTQAEAPRFKDAAAASGLAFAFDSGATPARQLPEVMSGGVGLIDFDGDGRLDVYAPQGGPFPPPAGRPPMGDRLFRNRGDGTFEDATTRSGLAGFAGGYSHGVAVGDVDDDGHPDLFVTRWRGYALYRNRGDGTFEDLTEPAGLGGDRDWPTSAAFADLDGDGDLDLYVCHYLRWDADHPRICPGPAGAGNRSCDPRHFEAMPDHAFRNDGGRFAEVRLEGFDDRDGRGLGVTAADVDDDGRVDLFVANDGSANYLLMNRGGFRFEESGLAAGVACNADGAYQAGMGTAAGDLDGDGRLDLVVTNFYGESTTFFRNLGDGTYADRTAATGLGAASRSLLGFGVAMLDANSDGRLDLATANGHVNDDRPDYPFAMPAQLLLGVEGGRLEDLGRAAGPPWSVPRVGRGLAAGDLDNDGRVDLAISAQDAPLAYFHNRSPSGHWLAIGLEGTASNRDGVGARVAVAAGGRRQVAQRLGGGSYLSASDPRLHFGLGPADRVEEIEVRWPSGRVDHHRGLGADAGYLLREGDPEPRPLPGFRAGPGREAPGR